MKIKEMTKEERIEYNRAKYKEWYERKGREKIHSKRENESIARKIKFLEERGYKITLENHLHESM